MFISCTEYQQVLPPVVLHEMGNKVTERKGEGDKYTVKWEWNKRHIKRDTNEFDWIRRKGDEENMQEIRGTKSRYWKPHA
jgi:hypothetical protein